MIWTNLGAGRDVPNSWHRATVTKTHSGRGRYSHNARFSDGVRGVALGEDDYVVGTWVPIALENAPTCEQAAPTRNGRRKRAGETTVPLIPTLTATV